MRTLPYGFPLLTLVAELSFTIAQLKAHPRGAPYVKEFEDLHAATIKTLMRQLELVAVQATAEAKVQRSDDTLTQLLELINLALASVTDRSSPLYQRFFGSQRPSEVKRLILGPKLELMQDWLPIVKGTTIPELAAQATPLETAVKVADGAAEALHTAEQQLIDWSNIGAYKELIDKVNGTRKATHGKLAELVHKHPEANLPKDFAERFFVQQQRPTAPTRKELVAKIARTEQQLTRLRQQLAEQDERQAQAERTQRESQAEALRREVAAIERRVEDERLRASALKSKLQELSPPAP